MRFEKVKKNTVTTYLPWYCTRTTTVRVHVRVPSKVKKMLAAIWTQLDSLYSTVYQNKPKKSQLVYTYIGPTYCTRTCTACRECSGTVLKLLYLKIISPEGLPTCSDCGLRTHSNNLGNNTA